MTDSWGAQPARRTVLEDRIRDLLRDLSRALADAIAESSDVNEALQRLQEEGYGLVILLDRRSGEGHPGDRSGDREVRLETIRPGQPRALVRRPPALPAPRSGAPVFQINGGDLAFLKSIGIDPTRRSRGRSRRPPQPDPGASANTPSSDA